MNLKILLQAAFISLCLSLWPMFARRSGISGNTVNLLHYLGSTTAVTTLWVYSSTTTSLQTKWVFVIIAMGLLSGYCLNLHTNIIVNKQVQVGTYLLVNSLLYIFFSLIFDWLINGAKISGTQRFGILLAVAAMYCLGQKK